MGIGSISAHAGYLFIVGLAFFFSISLVGWRRVFDPRRIACIYYAFMFVTYWLRPLLEYIIFRDASLLAHINDHYEPVTFGDITVISFGLIVAVTLIVFALAYRAKSPKRLEQLHVSQHYPAKHLVRYAYWGLIALGYVGFLIAMKGGGAMVKTSAGAGMVGTTGYFFLINYMVAAGCILRFAVTGKLITSVAIGLPWLAVHVLNGYNRYIMITFIIGIGIIWLSRRPTIPVRKLIALVCLVPVILMAFNIMHVSRRAFRDADQLKEAFNTILRTSPNTYFRGFAGHEGGLITLDRLNQGLDHSAYGTHLIYKTVIWPIPRMAWSGKPYPAEFSWRFITSLGSDRTLDYNYASVFHIFFVRGSIGLDLNEWGRFLFWLNPLWLGLLAGFMERKCLVPGGHPVLISFYAVFLASFILIGRNTIYELAGPYIYAFYAPYVMIYFVTAYTKGFKQPRLIMAR